MHCYLCLTPGSRQQKPDTPRSSKYSPVFTSKLPRFKLKSASRSPRFHRQSIWCLYLIPMLFPAGPIHIRITVFLFFLFTIVVSISILFANSFHYIRKLLFHSATDNKSCSCSFKMAIFVLQVQAEAKTIGVLNYFLSAPGFFISFRLSFQVEPE